MKREATPFLQERMLLWREKCSEASVGVQNREKKKQTWYDQGCLVQKGEYQSRKLQMTVAGGEILPP